MEPSDLATIGALSLLLDGEVVASERVVLEFAGRHLCVKAVGCGASGSNRTLSLA